MCTINIKKAKFFFRFCLFFSIVIFIVLPLPLRAQDGFSLPQDPIIVRVDGNLNRLLLQDKTPIVQKQKEKTAQFWIKDIDGLRYEVKGLSAINAIRADLKIAEEKGEEVTYILPSHIYASNVQHISQSIKERYWDALTRRVDGDHLQSIFKDDKMEDSLKNNYVYVPHDDEAAYKHFTDAAKKYPKLRIIVEKLPQEITPQYMKSIEKKHGILTLAHKINADGKYVGVPFVVPGGRFNEMYGWDSYFESLGLLVDGRIDLAKAMADNFVYQIEHYGKILNANRTYYLTRSQPPFLTSLMIAVYEKLPRTKESKKWLKRVLSAAIKEYNNVWMDKDHLTSTGLSRYHGGDGLGQPTEVEPGHYDVIYARYSSKYGYKDSKKFAKAYTAGKIVVSELDEFFLHDRSVRESGHDTTYRWGDSCRCADFVTVDLNSLLYKTEIDVARIIKDEFGGKITLSDGSEEKSSLWYSKARKRKELIMKYLWNKKRGMFFDYDIANKSQYEYISATAFYPLWARHADDSSTALMSNSDAKILVDNLLSLLEMPGGVVASTESSRGKLSDSRPARQWDYPNGWPPHQMIAWQGLINYGFDDIAQRLIYRWLYTITSNAVDYYGAITEKLDVVNRSHDVFAEYGNVGLDFNIIPREGFGWMDASYQVGLDFISRHKNLRLGLEKLIPPEWFFYTSAKHGDSCKPKKG